MCDGLNSPRNGFVSPAAKVQLFNSTAVYSCKSGWQIDGGTNPRTCQEDGTWSGKAPSCTSKKILYVNDKSYLIITKLSFTKGMFKTLVFHRSSSRTLWNKKYPSDQHSFLHKNYLKLKFDYRCKFMFLLFDFFLLCLLLSNIVVMYSADKTTKPSSSGSPSLGENSFLVVVNINVILFINWILRLLN